EHVLIGQLDTVILRPIPSLYFKFAFVGAPCGLITGNQYILNGGFSLRRRSIMLEITTTHPGNGEDAEDIYFTRILRAKRFPIPTIQEAMAFCAETLVCNKVYGPVGIHGTTKYWIPSRQME
ncbi:unnamed protein product, partial [Phaeothamnion confervicola]